MQFYNLGLPNGRTRVYELRDQDGLLIETLPCPREYHEKDAPHHMRYRWLWNGNPAQLLLLGTR